MRITNRTLKRLFVLTGLVLLCGGLTASSCVKDRMIDVVAGGELTAQFEARGSDNTWNGSESVDLASEVSSILDDNNFDSDSIRATLESVSYRVIEKDPTTTRTITGTIRVASGGSPATLVQLTSVLVDDPANEDWVSVPLNQAGTDLVNQALKDAIANPHSTLDLTLSVDNGTSTPIDVPTHFTWEARVKLSIVGTKKITVFQPL